MTSAADMPTASPPSKLATFLEIRAPLDWATVVLRAPQLLGAPRGDGRPIMLLPGYGTDEGSMRPLGRYLRFLGYRVYDWGLGRNSAGITQPVTSIYSKLDGVVGWRASVDIYNRQARNIEVYSSHFGIGANGRVWRLIADILGGGAD
jgi:pimeloyl-ACP methyl ester carboxylesterase